MFGFRRSEQRGLFGGLGSGLVAVGFGLGDECGLAECVGSAGEPGGDLGCGFGLEGWERARALLELAEAVAGGSDVGHGFAQECPDFGDLFDFHKGSFQCLVFSVQQRAAVGAGTGPAALAMSM